MNNQLFSQSENPITGIENLLSEAFGEEGFTILCFDYFPEVYRKFNATITFREKVRLLLTYWGREKSFEELRTYVEQFKTKLDILKANQPKLSSGIFSSDTNEYLNLEATIQANKNNEAVEELISILNLRAERILRFMEKQKLEGGPQRSAEEVRQELEATKKLFLELHKNNIEAIRRGQLILSHELVTEIHYLLLLWNCHISPDAISMPPPSHFMPRYDASRPI